MKILNYTKFGIFRCYQYLLGCAEALRSGGVKSAAAYAGNVLKEMKEWRDPERDAIRQATSDFDKKWGTDTSGVISPRFLGLTGENALFANYYKGTRPRIFRVIMDSLDIDPGDYEFVDYGSGKGLAVLLASEYPFKKITGVELSPILHNIATENLRTYASPTQKCQKIEFLCMDATHHELPQVPMVVYLFDPFPDAKVFKKWLSRIESSLAKNPRDVFIVYVGPSQREYVEASPFFAVLSEHDNAVVFTNRKSIT